MNKTVDRPVIAEPVTKEWQFCASTISIKASRCPNCMSDLGLACVRR
jgi:hypothetical protein